MTDTATIIMRESEIEAPAVKGGKRGTTMKETGTQSSSITKMISKKMNWMNLVEAGIILPIVEREIHGATVTRTEIDAMRDIVAGMKKDMPEKIMNVVGPEVEALAMINGTTETSEREQITTWKKKRTRSQTTPQRKKVMVS